MQMVENSPIVEDLLWLYEISLAIGQSLDARQTGRDFLRILVARRHLIGAAIWWKDEDTGTLELIDALPRAQLEARVERARLTAKVDAEAARAAFEAIFAADLRELTSVVSPVNVPALLEDSAVAREALARVEARQPEVANAWRFTAGLWAEAGVPERALASARKALAIAERSPQNDEKHSMATDQATCGSALLALGRPREALIAFELSLTLWPEYVPAKQGRAQARSMLDR